MYGSAKITNGSQKIIYTNILVNNLSNKIGQQDAKNVNIIYYSCIAIRSIALLTMGKYKATNSSQKSVFGSQYGLFDKQKK